MLNFLKSFSVAGIVRRAFGQADGTKVIERFELKTVGVEIVGGDHLDRVCAGALRLDMPRVRQRMAEIVTAQKRLRPICHSPLPFYQAPVGASALDFYKASTQFYMENPVWAAKRDYEALAIEMTGLLCLTAASRQKLHLRKLGGGKRGPRYGFYKDAAPFTPEDQLRLVRTGLKDWAKYLITTARVA